MKNYYDLLEVNPKASKEIIEKAYRVLIKKYHPDLYQGAEKIYAETKVKELNDAYHILSNDFLREQYDLELEKENQFNNLNNNKNKIKENKDETQINEEDKKVKEHKVGTLMSMIDLLKIIFKRKNKNGKPREIKREDKIAAVLTIIIVIVIGVILWFIPATNGFIRSLVPF